MDFCMETNNEMIWWPPLRPLSTPTVPCARNTLPTCASGRFMCGYNIGVWQRRHQYWSFHFVPCSLCHVQPFVSYTYCFVGKKDSICFCKERRRRLWRIIIQCVRRASTVPYPVCLFFRRERRTDRECSRVLVVSHLTYEYYKVTMIFWFLYSETIYL